MINPEILLQHEPIYGESEPYNGDSVLWSCRGCDFKVRYYDPKNGPYADAVNLYSPEEAWKRFVEHLLTRTSS